MQTAVHSEVMDVLCPMHLRLDGAGRITHLGPTLRKIAQASEVLGKPLWQAFDVTRPRDVGSLAALACAPQGKLQLRLREGEAMQLKGVFVPVPGAAAGSIINLSFGISVIDAVSRYALTNADFAATDLAIETLYLVEAQSAAMHASQQLNRRLQGAKVAAEEQAFTDTLTGLKNRRALDHVLERLLVAKLGFAVMHIDLDYFKAVNDTLGHGAGDHVLQVVAAAMVEETRSGDTVARVGGDEFTVVLPDVRDVTTLEAVGRRIISRIEEPISYRDHTCEISASIGTVWIQASQSPTREALLEDADIALYASKHRGRAQQTVYSPDLRDDAAVASADSNAERGR
ncbi:GGDEF domain-containing protein [Sulfitobacter sp. S190]|uniref:GGDEF domain-containing protein n=1 Tax=Sulfitobacter sp. S190 TaxID=2867022 RepID=UPI0021A8519C|nr:GGDEF domain-containing protein [Sulfitobacter sp. S190]UWR23507.1 GGDEF domain-containing protein [Sulfitobacter sp. S190]